MVYWDEVVGCSMVASMVYSKFFFVSINELSSIERGKVGYESC